jgi:16S rRNA (guanine(966)-N(2))-methyltransferase RsmD
MRIIAGKSRGVKLTRIKGTDIRPTPDRVRESVFNIIGSLLEADGSLLAEECVFLDLFCGTGANGLEALSRGVGRSIFVDSSARSLGIVRENAEKIGVIGDCSIIRGALPGKLGYVSGQVGSGGASIIYADPPYNYMDYEGLLEGLLSSCSLSAEGILIIEHEAKREISGGMGNLRRYREVQYGRTQVSFYRNASSES